MSSYSEMHEPVRQAVEREEPGYGPDLSSGVIPDAESEVEQADPDEDEPQVVTPPGTPEPAAGGNPSGATGVDEADTGEAG